MKSKQPIKNIYKVHRKFGKPKLFTEFAAMRKKLLKAKLIKS